MSGFNYKPQRIPDEMSRGRVIDHWRKVQGRVAPNSYAYRLACAALEELYGKSGREPGCDDE